MESLNNYKVWTAIITPLNDDKSVDYKSLEKLLRLQENAGNGITLLGSTGEALNLEINEKKRIVEFTCQLSLNTSIMVGCGGAVLTEQIKWIDFLNQQNIQAILLATPYYSKPGDTGQFEWFKALFDKSNFPVCLYNIPGRAAVKLSMDAFKRLSNHRNFWALKEASGSTDDFISYRNAAANCHMLSGDDPMFGEFIRHNAQGVVSVAGNVWPEKVQKIANQFAEGNFTNEQLFVSASKALFSASNPIPAKSILADKGVIKSDKVLPPLSEKDMVSLDEIRNFDQKLQTI